MNAVCMNYDVAVAATLLRGKSGIQKNPETLSAKLHLGAKSLATSKKRTANAIHLYEIRTQTRYEEGNFCFSQ